MNIWKKRNTILLPSINGGNIGRNPTRLSDNKLYYYSHGAAHSEAHYLLVLSEDDEVIASTDKSLGLPGIPESFLKDFCECGGMNEVMVEYEEDYDYSLLKKDTPASPESIVRLMPKTDHNWEISIRPVKETWTRDEVISFCEKLLRATGPEIKTTMNIKDSRVEFDHDSLHKWIEQNL